MALAVALAVLGVLAAPEAVSSAAHAACTIGTPDGTTCGEALVLLGYP